MASNWGCRKKNCSVRAELGYKIDSYVCYHISAASTFFMHGSLTCWTWSTLPKFVAIIPRKKSWTVSYVFTGNIYALLPTGYLVDIFSKKHFVTSKVAAFLLHGHCFLQMHVHNYILSRNWRFRNWNCCECMPLHIYVYIYIHEIF